MRSKVDCYCLDKCGIFYKIEKNLFEIRKNKSISNIYRYTYLVFWIVDVSVYASISVYLRAIKERFITLYVGYDAIGKQKKNAHTKYTKYRVNVMRITFFERGENDILLYFFFIVYILHIFMRGCFMNEYNILSWFILSNFFFFYVW